MLNNKFTIFCSRECPRRSLDSGRLYDYLMRNGWGYTRKPSLADLIVVFSCGAYQHTEEMSHRAIQRALEAKKRKANVLVTGCLLRIHPESLQKYVGAAEFIDTNDLSRLDALIRARIPYERIPDCNFVPDMNDLGRGLTRLAKSFRDHFHLDARFARKSLRYLSHKRFKAKCLDPECLNHICAIKISEGCLGKCTFCAIRIARGTLQSKKTEAVLQEFRSNLDKGHKRFVLVGEDTGCYGLDIGTNIVCLLKRIFSFPDEFSLILSDFNVQWLIRYSRDLLPMFRQNRQRIEEIHIPLQSGSDRILELMKRPYRIDAVKKTLCDLHCLCPDVKMILTLMVGFPGETEEDFELSRNMMTALNFARFKYHRYEDRPGTEATDMPHKIPEKTKASRARTLTKLDNYLYM